MADIERVAQVPVLLQGRRQIAACFRVRPAVVTQWAREGAPMYQAGQMWQADYMRMVLWLERHSPVTLRG